MKLVSISVTNLMSPLPPKNTWLAWNAWRPPREDVLPLVCCCYPFSKYSNTAKPFHSKLRVARWTFSRVQLSACLYHTEPFSFFLCQQQHHSNLVSHPEGAGPVLLLLVAHADPVQPFSSCYHFLILKPSPPMGNGQYGVPKN